VNLCVYAIMLNEQPNVANWVATANIADNLFVLDTGSTDGTPEELETHGVIVRRAKFDPFRFDDARNAALALAPEADLYLRLDADERLPEDWRFQIEDVYDPTVARYRYRVHNNGGVWETITRDDLHRRAGFRWRYPTHEILVGPPATVDIPGLVVEHTSPDERRLHHHTNLGVLLEAVQEYPGDARMTFYLAREYWYAGDWDFARNWIIEFLDIPNGWAPERAEAYRILAAIDYHPERWLWKAVGESPERREPWVDLARHFLAEHKTEEAGMAISMAYLRNDQSIYTTDPQCWGEPFQDLMTQIAQMGASV